MSPDKQVPERGSKREELRTVLAERYPVAKKGPIRSALINVWRLSFLTVVWALIGFWVWLHGRIRMPRWLGGDAREVAVRLWTITWLTSVWVLLWGTISWANVLGGIGVALAIMILLPLPRVPVEGRLHPFVLLQIVARLMVDFCVSSAQVAWAAIRPGKPPLGAVVRVRVAIKSDMVLTLAVDYMNLVPGTMVLEIDHRRRMLYVHIFDVRSEARVKAFYKSVAWVERAFIRAFERDSEWHPSPYHGIDDEFHHVSQQARRRLDKRGHDKQGHDKQGHDKQEGQS